MLADSYDGGKLLIVEAHDSFIVSLVFRWQLPLQRSAAERPFDGTVKGLLADHRNK